MAHHNPYGKPYGVVRSISKQGNIVEASYKNGKAHGLMRLVDDTRVAVELYQENKLLAFFNFYQDFEETGRGGNQSDLLEFLTPEVFKKPAPVGEEPAEKDEAEGAEEEMMEDPQSIAPDDLAQEQQDEELSPEKPEIMEENEAEVPPADGVTPGE